MKRYLLLYLGYLKMGVKALVSYRSDFWVYVVSMAVAQAMTLAFIGILFSKITTLGGWTLDEVILMYGFGATGGGLAAAFFQVSWRLGGIIEGGGLDQVLVRPGNPLFLLIGEGGINVQPVGTIAVGISALVYSLTRLPGGFHGWWLLYVPLVAVSSTLVYFGIPLMTACLQFWFVGSRSLMYPVFFLYEFARFPVVIYAWPLRILLTYVIPFATVTFYPAAYLARGAAYRVGGLLAPVTGFIVLSVALGVWKLALRRYKSTGS